MSVQVIKKSHQAYGQFNGGEILENKPIGFLREGGELKPYSNLFYWSHAWSEEGSTIGLHPHQGFEIMSFVTEGSIEHYDTAHKEWRKLETGAAQIIRAGNGISHSERINAKGHLFQIWFDPNLDKTIQQAASYNDYPHEVFPMVEENGIKTKIYRGEGSPLQMESEGIEIFEKWMPAGEHRLSLARDKVYSIYLVKGQVSIGGEQLEENDFCIVKDQDSILCKVPENAQIFIISSFEQVSYPTYAEMYGRQ